MSLACLPEPSEIASTELADLRGLRVAYLVNQYPQPSHSFIRREIAALESLGAAVDRFTLRASTGALVDTRDLRERTWPRAVLDEHPLLLAWATLSNLLRQPSRGLSALGQALRCGVRSDRGLLNHLAYLVEACVLKRWLEQRKIRHVHAHFGTNAATVAMFCRLLGGPSYSFTVHGPEEFDKPEFLHLRAKIAHSAFAVAISAFGRSQLQRVAELADWSKIQVIRCGVDDLFLDVEPMPPVDAPQLVCIARLHEQKGLPTLVEAARRLRARGRWFNISVVGDGPLRSALQRQIDAAGLTRNVELVGWCSNDEVRRRLLESRALVLPSFAEGLPVVLMEALALHRPVISTYVAGIPELVIPGENGWLTPASDVDALVDALDDALTSDVARLAELGAAGAARVQQRHSARQEASRLGQLFQACEQRA